MVILNIDLKVSGDEVGHKIGNPTNAETEGDSKQAQIVQSAQSAQPVPQQQSNIS